MMFILVQRHVLNVKPADRVNIFVTKCKVKYMKDNKTKLAVGAMRASTQGDTGLSEAVMRRAGEWGETCREGEAFVERSDPSG